MALHEDHTIKSLRNKWWKEKNVPVDIDGVKRNCTKVEDDDTTDVAHIYGIFVVLAVGMVLSLIAGIIEFLWNVRKISIEQKVQRNIL